MVKIPMNRKHAGDSSLYYRTISPKDHGGTNVCMFLGLLILRNLHSAYMGGECLVPLKENQKEKKIKTFERNPFQRFFHVLKASWNCLW